MSERCIAPDPPPGVDPRHGVGRLTPEREAELARRTESERPMAERHEWEGGFALRRSAAWGTEREGNASTLEIGARTPPRGARAGSVARGAEPAGGGVG